MQAGSAGPVRLQLLALALTLLCDGAWAGCCWMLQEQTLGGGALGLYGSFIFACPIDHYSPNMAVALHLWKNNPDDHDPVLECSVTRSDGTIEPPFFGGTGDDAHNPLPSPLVAGRYDSSGVGELVGTGVEPGDVVQCQLTNQQWSDASFHVELEMGELQMDFAGCDGCDAESAEAGRSCVYRHMCGLPNGEGETPVPPISTGRQLALPDDVCWADPNCVYCRGTDRCGTNGKCDCRLGRPAGQCACNVGYYGDDCSEFCLSTPAAATCHEHGVCSSSGREGEVPPKFTLYDNCVEDYNGEYAVAGSHDGKPYWTQVRSPSRKLYWDNALALWVFDLDFDHSAINARAEFEMGLPRFGRSTWRLFACENAWAHRDMNLEIEAPRQVRVGGGCRDLDSISGVYTLDGQNNHRPIWRQNSANGQGAVLYFDDTVAGPRWYLDDDTSAASVFASMRSSYGLPPFTTNSWQAWCAADNGVAAWVDSSISLTAMWTRHGLQADSLCRCQSEYYGSTCERHCRSYPTCSGNGECNPVDGLCDCYDGYFGAACDVYCHGTCNGNGQCNSEGQCACEPGYYGAYCEHTCYVSECESTLMTTHPLLSSQGSSCDGVMDIMSREINRACCSDGGCADGSPDECSTECAATFMPFYSQCRSTFSGDHDMEAFYRRCTEEEFDSNFARFDCGTVPGPVLEEQLLYSQLWSAEDCAKLCADVQYSGGIDCKAFYWSQQLRSCVLTTQAPLLGVAVTMPCDDTTICNDDVHNVGPTAQEACEATSRGAIEPCRWDENGVAGRQCSHRSYEYYHRRDTATMSCNGIQLGNPEVDNALSSLFPQCEAFLTCLPGFVPSEDRNECVDVNECFKQACHPSAACINSVGSYRCSCSDPILDNCHEFSTCSETDCFCGQVEHAADTVVAHTLDRITQAQAYRLQGDGGGTTTGFVLEDLCNERYLMELECMQWNATVLSQMEPLYNLACAMAENNVLQADIFALRQATEVRDLSLAAYQQKLAGIKAGLAEMQRTEHVLGENSQSSDSERSTSLGALLTPNGVGMNIGSAAHDFWLEKAQQDMLMLNGTHESADGLGYIQQVVALQYSIDHNLANLQISSQHLAAVLYTRLESEQTWWAAEAGLSTGDQMWDRTLRAVRTVATGFSFFVASQDGQEAAQVMDAAGQDVVRAAQELLTTCFNYVDQHGKSMGDHARVADARSFIEATRRMLDETSWRAMAQLNRAVLDDGVRITVVPDASISFAFLQLGLVDADVGDDILAGASLGRASADSIAQVRAMLMAKVRLVCSVYNVAVSHQDAVLQAEFMQARTAYLQKMAGKAAEGLDSFLSLSPESRHDAAQEGSDFIASSLVSLLTIGIEYVLLSTRALEYLQLVDFDGYRVETLYLHSTQTTSFDDIYRVVDEGLVVADNALQERWQAHLDLPAPECWTQAPVHLLPLPGQLDLLKTGKVIVNLVPPSGGPGAQVNPLTISGVVNPIQLYVVGVIEDEDIELLVSLRKVGESTQPGSRQRAGSNTSWTFTSRTREYVFSYRARSCEATEATARCRLSDVGSMHQPICTAAEECSYLRHSPYGLWEVEVDVVQSDASMNDIPGTGTGGNGNGLSVDGSEALGLALDGMEELRFNICVNGVAEPGQLEAAAPSHCNTPDEDVSTFCRPLPVDGAAGGGQDGVPPAANGGTGGGGGGGGGDSSRVAANINMNGLIRNCQTMLLQIAASELHSVCCTEPDTCANGYPLTCNDDCASLWAPFAQRCSVYVEEIFPELTPFTAQCEEQAYGAQRCSTTDYRDHLGSVAQECCGANGENCAQDPMASALPSSCNYTATCASTYEGFYAQCRPRLEGFGHQRLTEFTEFLATCQASAYVSPHRPPGNGH